MILKNYISNALYRKIQRVPKANTYKVLIKFTKGLLFTF